jgi:hypothetical protein
MSTARILRDFEGVWTLQRNIDQADGTNACFEGHATWSPQGAGMRYHEIGTLQMENAPAMQAERKYTWTSELDVYFEDGRFFHTVPATGGTSEHWCDPDTYRAIYDFKDWPEFSVKWQVSGPRKAYSMHASYRRR